jgi:CheY-like chemotaxis protein
VNILFVDDDPDIADLYRINGRLLGVDVTGFTSGGEALSYLEMPETETDVVLLDLMLPTLDGLTIAEEIRRNETIHPERRPVKIAFVTAANQSDAIKRIGGRVKVEAIYQKPADLRQVITDAKEWIK